MSHVFAVDRCFLSVEEAHEYVRRVLGLRNPVLTDELVVRCPAAELCTLEKEAQPDAAHTNR